MSGRPPSASPLSRPIAVATSSGVRITTFATPRELPPAHRRMTTLRTAWLARRRCPGVPKARPPRCAPRHVKHKQAAFDVDCGHRCTRADVNQTIPHARSSRGVAPSSQGHPARQGLRGQSERHTHVAGRAAVRPGHRSRQLHMHWAAVRRHAAARRTAVADRARRSRRPAWRWKCPQARPSTMAYDVEGDAHLSPRARDDANRGMPS